jgi:hypothetical protein
MGIMKMENIAANVILPVEIVQYLQIIVRIVLNFLFYLILR